MVLNRNQTPVTGIPGWDNTTRPATGHYRPLTANWQWPQTGLIRMDFIAACLFTKIQMRNDQRLYSHAFWSPNIYAIRLSMWIFEVYVLLESKRMFFSKIIMCVTIFWSCVLAVSNMSTLMAIPNWSRYPQWLQYNVDYNTPLTKISLLITITHWLKYQYLHCLHYSMQSHKPAQCWVKI